MNTLDLIASEGLAYVCDWINDDLPYPLRTKRGPLHAMPLSHEISDQMIMHHYHHSEQAFIDQVCDQFDVLYRESDDQGGRLMSLTIHPWMSGQPHRIKALKTALTHIVGHEGVWSATGAEILAAYRAQN